MKSALLVMLLSSTQAQLQAELERIIAGQDELPSLAEVQRAAIGARPE